MINVFEVRETNKMIEESNLDVRTITMGISLLDCCDNNVDVVCEKIYRKITEKAANLVKVGEQIELDYGIPIVNKRISVTPIALVGGSCCKTPEDYVKIAKTLDRAAHTVGINFLGGYSALVSKGMTPADKLLIESIPQALAETELVCSSVNVGSTKTGIDMDAVKMLGETVKKTAELTKDNDSLGCAKLVIFCNAPDDNPFMAGAFHGVTEGDVVINVGVSGPGVVKRAIEEVKGQDFGVLCETIKKTAFKVTRVGQLVAQEASRRLNVPFGIIDLSLAPTPAVGDSVAEILQEMGLERVGAPGTTAALALLNDQVKKGGIMASSYVGGLSGAFIPVSEDQGMIDAVNTLNSLAEAHPDAESYVHNHALIRSTQLQRGLKLYNKAIVASLGAMLRNGEPGRADGTGRWNDVAGQYVPRREVKRILDAIANGGIDSLEGIDRAFDRIAADYDHYARSWAEGVLAQLLGHAPSPEEIAEAVTAGERTRETLRKSAEDDRARDCSPAMAVGYGVDADSEEEKMQDYHTVRGIR